MRTHRGKRIIPALLVLVIFAAYLYLQIEGYEELRAPRPVAQAPAASAAPEAGEAVLPAPSEAGGPSEPGLVTPAPSGEAPAGSVEPPAPTVDPASPYGKALANAAAQGLPQPPEIDVTSWELTLVNGDHSIGQYAPEQLAYLNQTLAETDIQTAYNGNRCPVDGRIAEQLIAFGLACKEAGHPVFLSSGYRSYSDQAANFTRICQNNGISDGKDAAGHYITMPPGCSEHQLALCCDITDKYYPTKTPEKVASPTIDWLQANCTDYGFVLRFPAGKEDITGVMHESWHFRYVGQEAARYMTDNQLTLEEFLALYGVE